LKLYIFWALLFFSGYQRSFGQDIDSFYINKKAPYPLQFNTKIAGSFKYFTTDILDNIYVITTSNQLKEYNEKGDSIAFFKDFVKYGLPSYMDVNNPQKILLFYKNFGSITILDRFLQTSLVLHLRKKNLSNVTAVANSYDNNIWMLDEQDFKIKKVNTELELLLESNDIRILTGVAPAKSQLFDNYNEVILYDKNAGFFIFDYYGAYKNRLPFVKWEKVGVYKKTLYGFSENKFFLYNRESLQLREIELPDHFKNYQDIKAINGKIFLLTPDGIEIFKIK